MKRCISQKNMFAIGVLVLAVVLMSSCLTVKFVSDYDEKIDIGITELQKMTENYLLMIESGIPYEQTKEYFKNITIEVNSLRLRADASERNSITVKMLDKLMKNLNRLKEDYSEGIIPEEVPVYRGALNSQFTAILTFEIAKIRGVKMEEDEALTPATESTN